MNLIKLHGSINWFSEFNRIRTDPYSDSRPRIMLFGEGMAKVNPQGPFIELRHIFSEHLSRTDTLGVIGYSFGDQYVNAIIKAWMNEKKLSYKRNEAKGGAKLVLLSPNKLTNISRNIGQSYFSGRYKEVFVDIVQVIAGAKEGMSHFITEIDSPKVVGLRRESDVSGWRFVEPCSSKVH